MIEIKLTQNKVALIDDEDFDLSEINWYAVYDKFNYYAQRSFNGIKLRLHNVVLERVLGRKLTINELCDHVNGDTLDDRRENLRIASYGQNSFNKKVFRTNKVTSIFKGVYFKYERNKYQARITCNKITYHLGYFDNEIDAGKAYDKKAKELFGEFTKLNFPEEVLV